jgi:hypothetical protein
MHKSKLASIPMKIKRINSLTKNTLGNRTNKNKTDVANNNVTSLADIDVKPSKWDIKKEWQSSSSEEEK